jgi:hypothetical protein
MKRMGIILLIMFFVVSVNALTITGETDLSMCQCETVRTTMEVCADTSGIYNVNLSGNGARWFSVAPEELSITAGECKDVFVFVTPECYATSGTFPVELNISGPESLTETVTVDVQQCHTFDYAVDPLYNSSRACENNTFNLYVKNTGKFSDEFVLIQSGLSDSWVNYPRESFVLSPGEVLNETLVVNSECSTPSGSYGFGLELSNTKTNAAETENLTQEIVNFRPFVHDLPLQISTCEEQDKNLTFAITNVSNKDDELTLTLLAPNFISIDKDVLSLTPNKTQNVTLSIANTDPVSDVFTLRVYSKVYDTNYDILVSYNVNDCYNIGVERGLNRTSTLEVDANNLENTFCFGETEQHYIVRNYGTKTTTVNVSVDGIASTSESTILAPNTSGVVTLVVSPLDYGQANIVVNATTTSSTDSVNYSLNFENCYGSELNVQGLNVCANTQKTQTITVKNNGTMAQTYNLSTNASWITFGQTAVDLDANQEQEVTMVLDVPSDTSGRYVINAFSDNANITRTLTVNMLSDEQCYSYEIIKQVAALDVNCCSGEIAEIIIRNTGYFNQEIELSKIAPDWVSFSADMVSLAPSEEEIVYVYFSPPAGTNGQIIAQVNVTNQENISQIVDFNLTVFGGNCGVALEANLDVNNDITLTKIFTRKEVDVEFFVKNDSNVGFNIIDMNVEQFPDSEVDFERGVFLSPGETTKARITLSFLENYDPVDMNVKVSILTSVGTFDKNQEIKFTDSNEPVYNEVAITGFFLEYVGPAAGIILLIIILVVIVALVKKTPKPKAKKK